MTISAFVPARSGSKRLPGKNVKPLGGKPIILWTLEACALAPSIDNIIFSTDSLEYWELAREHLDTDKLILDHRSKDEAGDQIKIFDYLKQNPKKIFGRQDELFVMALPTAPFRRADQIEDAIAMCKDYKKPIFSATEYDFSVSFAFYLEEEGEWSPVIDPSPLNSGNTRSQDLPSAYHPNGAIYVRNIKDLMDPRLKTLYQGARPYIMDRISSIDVDTKTDFLFAEAILSSGSHR